MPYGLTNSGATLVKGLRKILGNILIFNYNWDDHLYWDDHILIFNYNWDDHLKTIKLVLKRLKQADVNRRLSKFSSAKSKIEFIGFEIENDTISASKDNITKVLIARCPNSKKEIQSFLGLTGYYRQFIPQYSTTAAPLTDLVIKCVPNTLGYLNSSYTAS